MRTTTGTLATLLALAAALAPQAAQALPRPLGYPGRSWGNLARDFSGLEGSLSQGWVTQGVEWTKVPGGAGLETAVLYQWRMRSRNRLYYNEHGPAATLALRGKVFDGGLYLGWERFPELRETQRDFNLFATWFKSWDLAARARPEGFLRLPLTTWGRVARDLDSFEGSSAQGWVELGVDWFELPGGAVVQPFAAYRWRLRTENEEFYNAVGPAAGVQLVRRPFIVGLEHSWRRFTELRQETRQLGVFLSWYVDWDLARAAR